MTISEKLYTLSEFEALCDEQPERLLELIDGRIVEKVTNEKHGKIATNIAAELRAWVKRSANIRGHYGVENTYRLPDDDMNERRPDVSFRYTTDKPSEMIHVGLPDFAVEVKSPKNTYEELREKAQFYLEHGTQLVWLVYPVKQIVEVYFVNKPSELYTIDDTLDGGDILPGFQMTVADVFEI
jgi:Uma2 family endonuclease